MNILIITTYFPPDTAIASVRPYMFAKYLTQVGHKVTVLRSGMLTCTADDTMSYENLGIRVISYMGRDSASERFSRGEKVETQFSRTHNPFDILPYSVRKLANNAFETMKSMMVGLKVQRAKMRLAMQKSCIDAMQGEHFDVVFATYGQLENAYAGKYAAEKFGCKWILDFRDPIAQRNSCNYLTYLCWKRIQKKAVLSADVCTAVSDGIAQKVGANTNKKVFTLYNGYDSELHVAQEPTGDRVLRFAYTGVMYKDRSAAPLFRAIKQLSAEGKINTDKICFEYAGPHFEQLLCQAKEHGVEKILVNHGFVGREEAAEIQSRSDIFLVLTWNTKYDKGVLPGKFYEGIRARKPILVLVSGNVPGSELSALNRKYLYGFCFEECTGEAEFESLSQWLLEAYRQKSSGSAVVYAQKETLAEDFAYRKLTQRLADIMQELVQ